MTWNPATWRSKAAAHQPVWPDLAELERIEKELASVPPLVFAGEARELKSKLAAVSRGEAFLLQAGDCAESFDGFYADAIRDKLRVILQMAVVLTYSSGVPAIKVGRIAGPVRQTTLEPHRDRRWHRAAVVPRSHGERHAVLGGRPPTESPPTRPGLQPVGVHPEPPAGLHEGWIRRPPSGPGLEPGVRRQLERGAALRQPRIGDRSGVAVHGGHRALVAAQRNPRGRLLSPATRR